MSLRNRKASGTTVNQSPLAQRLVINDQAYPRFPRPSELSHPSSVSSAHRSSVPVFRGLPTFPHNRVAPGTKLNQLTVA